MVEGNECANFLGRIMITREEVFSKVSEVLVEALNLEEDEVVLGAELGNDLGAEEIDYLDIAFRLEREFGINITRTRLFPEGVDDYCLPVTVQKICYFVYQEVEAIC